MNFLLDGLKVIDLASFLAAPGAATLMGDFGADVIKIEPPGGDGYRRLHGQWKNDYNWQLTSRNKQGISLDIGQPDGIEVLMRLLDDADVLVTNFRDDQLARYGLGWEVLHKRYPRLIVGQLTGYGNEGPDRLRRGYDSTAWFARTGIMQLTRGKDADPTFPAGGVGDHSTAMSLFAGIMMALFKRETTQEGSLVETSLIANGCWANGMGLQGAIAGFDLAEMQQARTRSPFAAVYETRDNQFVILVLTNTMKEWPELAAALGHDEWTSDERFSDMRTLMRNRDELRGLIAGAIGSMPLAAVGSALDKYQLTFGVVEGLTDVVKDAHLIENGVVTPTLSDDPSFQWTIANPIRVSGAATKKAGDPPSLGQHTYEVLSSHGFSDDDIDRLLKDGVAFAGGD